MNASTPLVPGSIARHPVCVLGKIGQVVFRLTEDALAGYGLRVRHFSVLQSLADAGASSQLELASYLRLDKATMVAILDDLEQLGLAERSRDPRDRRRHLLELTEKGLATLTDASAALDKLDTDVLGGMSKTTRQGLSRALAELNNPGPLTEAFDQLRKA